MLRCLTSASSPWGTGMDVRNLKPAIEEKMLLFISLKLSSAADWGGPKPG